MWHNRRWFNNRDACEDAGFAWFEVTLKDILNVSYPECARTSFSRVNQLGNSFDSTVASEPAALGGDGGAGGAHELDVALSEPVVIVVRADLKGHRAPVIHLHGANHSASKALLPPRRHAPRGSDFVPDRGATKLLLRR